MDVALRQQGYESKLSTSIPDPLLKWHLASNVMIDPLPESLRWLERRFQTSGEDKEQIVSTRCDASKWEDWIIYEEVVRDPRPSCVGYLSSQHHTDGVLQ